MMTADKEKSHRIIQHLQMTIRQTPLLQKEKKAVAKMAAMTCKLLLPASQVKSNSFAWELNR